ncbi:MAG: relaxase domain-containing protein [Novosphingobium sp.]
MVATISAIDSSAQASSYYEVDDYYADGGLSPSEWQGEGAKKLGLAGEIERDAFRDMLDGKLPDGPRLGTTRRRTMVWRGCEGNFTRRKGDQVCHCA